MICCWIDAELAGQLLAEPHHLAVGLLLLVGDAHGPQQPLLGEDGQLAAVEPVALGLRARHGGDLRRGDHLGLQLGGPEPSDQGEAGGPGLVDDLGDLRADGLEPLDEQVRVGRLGPGGDEAPQVGDDGDVVAGLVDVDADVGDLAGVEAKRRGGRADGAGLLGRGHGRGLREGDERVTCSSLPSERLRPSCYLFQRLHSRLEAAEFLTYPLSQLGER